MKLPVHPAALAELDAAIAYYEAERPGLGLELLDAVVEAVDFAGRVPAGGERRLAARARSDVRRFVVKRFPYVVYVASLGDRREVFAVAHTSRRPGYWRQRLR